MTAVRDKWWNEPKILTMARLGDGHTTPAPCCGWEGEVVCWVRMSLVGGGADLVE